jgi:hypothetical protein
MVMRYHFGLGVGHTYAHQKTGSSDPEDVGPEEDIMEEEENCGDESEAVDPVSCEQIRSADAEGAGHKEGIVEDEGGWDDGSEAAYSDYWCELASDHSSGVDSEIIELYS